MPGTNAKIELNSTGTNGKLELDGLDVSSATRGLVLIARVGEITELNLELAPRATTFQGEVQVTLDEATEKILAAAGWTRPEVTS